MDQAYAVFNLQHLCLKMFSEGKKNLKMIVSIMKKYNLIDGISKKIFFFNILIFEFHFFSTG